MSESAPHRRYRLFDFVPHVVSCITVAAGALVLAGWFFDIATLKGVMPGWTLIKANTAMTMVLCGVALRATQASGEARFWQLLGQVCSGIVLLLGLLTLGEYVSGRDFGIDQLLVREVTDLPGDIPGRMAISSALSFAAAGSALLLVIRGKGRFIAGIHALLLVPILVAGSALIGYSYDIEEILRERLSHTPMAPPTAVLFILLALGIACARSEYPFRRFLASDSAAGVMVRRLLPAVVILALATGWLILQGYRAGFFREVFGLAMFTTMNMTGLAILVLASARAFDRADALRKQAEERLRAASLYVRSLIEASPDPLVTISADGKITDVNTATEQAIGVARNALIGSDFSNYFTEPDKARAGYQKVFAKGFVTDYPLALRHVSGSVIDVLYNASVYRNEQGEVAGVFAAARDVTDLKRTEHALRERVKELGAFLYISELAARRDFSLESFSQELVNVLPQSWQYPEVACARIVIRGSEFRTANFSISAWMLAAPVSAQGGVVGKVEVGYLEHKPDKDEGPFLKEERQLIDAIAERISQIVELKDAEATLRASEELFRALANATSEGILIHEHGRIVEVNRQMEGILGRPRAEIIGIPVLDFVAAAGRDMVKRRVEVPEDARVEFAFLRPDGSEVLVSGLAHPCVYMGRPMRVAAYRDITLEKRAEETMRNVGTYNRSLIEVSLDPLVTISPDGKITDVNEATIQATGMPRSLLLGSDFSSYFTEPDKALAGYQEVFAKGFVADYPLSLRHVSGRTIDVLYNASVYRNAKGEIAGVFAAARDITERKKLERELEHQAHIDMLTDLNNRRHFMELAEHELARSRRHNEPLSLLMMDVDHFKVVNDTYGHDVGDTVLQQLSEVCRLTFRGIDIVGRLGGEEFVALLPETNLEQAMKVAERLRQAVESSGAKLENGSLIQFTVSIGVTSFGAKDDKLGRMLKRADTALYKAKNAGRNRVCGQGVSENDK